MSQVISKSIEVLQWTICDCNSAAHIPSDWCCHNCNWPFYPHKPTSRASPQVPEYNLSSSAQKIDRETLCMGFTANNTCHVLGYFTLVFRLLITINPYKPSGCYRGLWWLLTSAYQSGMWGCELASEWILYNLSLRTSSSGNEILDNDIHNHRRQLFLAMSYDSHCPLLHQCWRFREVEGQKSWDWAGTVTATWWLLHCNPTQPN
jgi:hypothetical protein